MHELARIGIERFEIATLAFTENHIEGQRRLAAARDTGDYGELVARHLDIDIFQIVFAGVVHHDRIACPVAQMSLQGSAVIGVAGGFADQILADRGRRRLGHLNLILAQRASGDAVGVRRNRLRCAHRHDFAAGVAAVRAEVDQPVGGTDHVEVVFDHQQ